MTLSIKSKSINNHKNKLQQQHLDYISICLTLGIILLLAILPCDKRLHIFQVIKNPLVISGILIISLFVGYYHFLSSMLILIMLVFLFLQDNYLFCLDKKNKRGNRIVTEGFVSKEELKDLDKKDEEEGLSLGDSKIKGLFKPGYFGKRLAEARQKNKEQFENTMAKNKAMLALEKKKRRMKQKAKSRNEIEDIEDASDLEDIEETFADNLDETQSGKKSGKAILKRKFDPTNEEDSNLLLTMEACSEIKDRISYNYENKEYLKRYIRDKLEEIIELLNLVDE
jgi:hypothetical protein